MVLNSDLLFKLESRLQWYLKQNTPSRTKLFAVCWQLSRSWHDYSMTLLNSWIRFVLFCYSKMIFHFVREMLMLCCTAAAWPEACLVSKHVFGPAFKVMSGPTAYWASREELIWIGCTLLSVMMRHPGDVLTDHPLGHKGCLLHSRLCCHWGWKYSDSSSHCLFKCSSIIASCGMIAEVWSEEMLEIVIL